MRNKNREFKSVEDFKNFRDALELATKSHRDDEFDELFEQNTYRTIDDMPDDSTLAFTDTVYMHAGMSLSQLGVNVGLEAPASLQEVHRRGELFMFASLGSVAVYEASKVISDLI